MYETFSLMHGSPRETFQDTLPYDWWFIHKFSKIAMSWPTWPYSIFFGHGIIFVLKCSCFSSLYLWSNMCWAKSCMLCVWCDLNHNTIWSCEEYNHCIVNTNTAHTNYHYLSSTKLIIHDNLSIDFKFTLMMLLLENWWSGIKLAFLWSTATCTKKLCSYSFTLSLTWNEMTKKIL